VLVLDLMMPGVDGLELLAQIRSVQPAVKAIIISGKLNTDSAEEEIAIRLRQQVEADAYLHKPVTVKRLLETIEAVSAEPAVANWKEITAEMVSETRTSVEAAQDASRSLRGLRKEE
jgi:CheY-like chemotaxis protein